MKKLRKKTVVLKEAIKKEIILTKEKNNVREEKKTEEKPEKISASQIIIDSPVISIKSLEYIVPKEEFISAKRLEPENSLSQPDASVNFSAYAVEKRGGNYSLNNEYFSSKNYDFQNQSPDGSPGVFMGSDFEREKNPQKSYDTENEQKKRLKRI